MDGVGVLNRQMEGAQENVDEEVIGDMDDGRDSNSFSLVGGEEISNDNNGDNENERSPVEKEQEEVELDGVIDISGEEWTFPLLDERGEGKLQTPERVRELYVYNNVFTLIPGSASRLKRLKTLKVFSNEVNLFPSEVGGFEELEHLQVKLCSSELGALPPLENLEALKVLDLCKIPPRPSAFNLSSEISSLRSLTRLSVCHFSISFLPSEIGSLKQLEELDLSFNKLKTLPNNIADLMALKSLKVASNKLVELPHGLSSLSNLQTVDVSNNRLTSLESLQLFSMMTLRELNAQHNKLRGNWQIPVWISCNLEGNDALEQDVVECESVNSSSEEEVSDSNARKEKIKNPSEGITKTSENMSTVRYSLAFRPRKVWKRQRRDNQQQKARQERLNSSRKLRAEGHQERENKGTVMESVPASNGDAPIKGSCSEKELDPQVQDVARRGKDPDDTGCVNAREIDSISPAQKSTLKGRFPLDDLNSKFLCCTDSISSNSGKVISNVRSIMDQSGTSIALVKEVGQLDGCSEASNDDFPKPVKRQGIIIDNSKNSSQLDDCSEASNDDFTKLGKRHGILIKNTKPSKRRRSVEEFSWASQKYSFESFCGVNDHLPDGFYDAGRDRPFKPLINFEKENLSLDSREIILVDRKRDEELDAIVLSAQKLFPALKNSRQWNEEESRSTVDDFHRVLLLALFVSDCFGGSDKSLNISTMRRAVVGANVGLPFVCSCSLDSNSNVTVSSEQTFRNITVPGISILCEKSVRIIKEQRNTNVVPIGALHYGVCRHRAILMKYLCDRADPPILCELVRGYMDYTPHAWNVILVNRDGKWVRMLVDACRPVDIRPEEDPEYFYRYIPLSRFCHSTIFDEDSVAAGNSGVTPCLYEEVGRGASGSVVQRCTLGNLTAAAKVRFLESRGSSKEQQKSFELNCLAEVRMLSALREHPCIVQLYGHKLSSSWVSSSDGTGESQVLQFIIAMEYIKGGCLEAWLERLAKEGKKCTPGKLALFVARDVACALVELHSKNIIHRDVKSRNVLIDLELKRSDESPLVKLCDFDRAVPLDSSGHTCCLAHHGVPPANICVGTPRWMAPEMMQAMHRPHRYGLEVDIWSFGCLILELLTLQIPFMGLSDVEVHNSLQMGLRPQLNPELDNLLSESKEKVLAGDEGIFPEEDSQILQRLVELFYLCTESNPSCRPTAKQAYEMLSAVSGPTPRSNIHQTKL